MRVLMVTNLLPGARRSGGEIVTQSVIDALFESGHDVRTLAYRRPGDVTPEARGEVCVGERPIETRAAGPHALAWMARALATGAPYTTTKWRSRAYLRAVRDELAEGPDVVIVDHAGVSVVLPHEVEAPIVLLSHNAEGEMYERVAAAGGRTARVVYGREAARIRLVEAELTARAAQTWALTESDADYHRALAPAADVRVLPVASAVREPLPPREPECDVALIGTWSWHANSHGLEWFVEEVVPLLPDGTSVAIAGRGADWVRERGLPGVTVAGVVHDAREFMSSARVIAIPSVTGGGIQIKTLDAVATGVPAVATEVATRGMSDLPSSLVVAADAAEFAAALERLAAAPDRERLRAEAVAWTAERHRRLAAEVGDWVGELVPAVAAVR